MSDLGSNSSGGFLNIGFLVLNQIPGTSMYFHNTKDQRYQSTRRMVWPWPAGMVANMLIEKNKVRFEKTFKLVCMMQSFCNILNWIRIFHCRSKMFQDQPCKPLWQTSHNQCVSTLFLRKPLEWGKSSTSPQPVDGSNTRIFGSSGNDLNLSECINFENSIGF